jgi:hypothetical protein
LTRAASGLGLRQRPSATINNSDPVIWFQKISGDEKGREIIATRIIDLARGGLIDPTALRDRVIAEARLAEERQWQITPWRDAVSPTELSARFVVTRTRRRLA